MGKGGRTGSRYKQASRTTVRLDDLEMTALVSRGWFRFRFPTILGHVFVYFPSSFWVSKFGDVHKCGARSEALLAYGTYSTCPSCILPRRCKTYNIPFLSLFLGGGGCTSHA